MDQLSHLPEGK